MRRVNDFYETAPWQVDALVDNLPELSGTILCPCVGDGSLMHRLQERRPDLIFITNDIDPAKAAEFHLDATTADAWNQMAPWPDWVVDNFPFNVEHRILQYAFMAARCGVVAMSRVSYAEPTKERGPWLAEHPYQKRITLERYSFTGDGKSDSTTTDWLVWAKVPIAGPFGISAFGYKSGLRTRHSLPQSVGAVDPVGERVTGMTTRDKGLSFVFLDFGVEDRSSPRRRKLTNGD